MRSIFLFSLFFCSVTAFAGGGMDISLYQGKKIVSGELIVKPTNKFLSNVIRLNGGIDLTVSRTIKLSYTRLYVVKWKEKVTIERIIEVATNSKKFDFVEPNYIYDLSLSIKAEVPTDPQAGMLWGLQNRGDNEPLSGGGTSPNLGVVGADLDVLRAWDITFGSREVRIAVIDTGVDYNHPDLKDNIWVNQVEKNGEVGVDDDHNGYVDDIYGYDFANDDGDPMDDHGHGSHVAGTIGATHGNGIGVAGVMRDVTMVPIKFLSDSGSGSTEGAIKAIDYATSLNVDIMSNSWGGGGRSQALFDAINQANFKGIIFIAAAGNNSSDNDISPHYPSSYDLPNVIAVAAHNAQNELASFSNYGKNSVHVAAPGRNILSTVKGGGYAVYSGTSMSTPHVAGTIGLLISHMGRLDTTILRERIILTSVPIKAFNRRIGHGGRLSAYNLLTDTRPYRNIPRDDAWKRVDLSEVFESAHPYLENSKLSRFFSIPGAKFIRVIVKKFELEANYDFLKIKGLDSDQIVDIITGRGEDWTSDYYEGDSIEVTFLSDYSINKWGFLISAIEYIE